MLCTTKNVVLYKWSLPALCSTEKSAGSPNVISQQGLATCFPHKISSVAKLCRCSVYATYELIDYREPGTKEATNGLKMDKNGLIHRNVSLMKVLASFVGFKKPLPPCQKYYKSCMMVFSDTPVFRVFFPFSKKRTNRNWGWGFTPRGLSTHHFFTNHPQTNTHKPGSVIRYISQRDINIWDRGVLWRILLWRRVAWGAKFF